MILKRFYDDKLAQASYLIGCAATGEAVVVDPERDVGRYIEAAEAEKLRITHVVETHIHADFVSGTRELAATTGATPYLSGEGGEEWSYGFAREDGALILRDGDTFEVGQVLLQAVHTPGHTPEHLCFLVTDRAATDRPFAILTGDFVFVGDVGRPDLLETAAGRTGTMEASARSLFHSLRWFRSLPDYLQVLPGHGAGSACGKAIGSMPGTTVGYERMTSWALRHDDEDAFVRAVLDGQPEPPAYFGEMKRINRDGPPATLDLTGPARLDAERLEALVAEDAVVVDTRTADDYAAAHVPVTINIPLNRRFNTWAGSLLPYDRDLYLVVDGEAALAEAVRDLAMIGLDRVVGWFDQEVVRAWSSDGREVEGVTRIGVDELDARIAADRAAILDVRERSEWREGHIPDALNIPVGRLPRRLDEVPRDRPLVVHCRTGSRSAIATSLLLRQGFTDVLLLQEGYEGWRERHGAGVTERPGSPATNAGGG